MWVLEISRTGAVAGEFWVRDGKSYGCRRWGIGHYVEIIQTKRCEAHWGTPKVLTIKLSVPGSQCVNQERATVLYKATEHDLCIPDQLLLRFTGTAGVLLRTDLKVLTWAEETGRNSGQQQGIL